MAFMFCCARPGMGVINKIPVHPFDPVLSNWAGLWIDRHAVEEYLNAYL